jgi:hypothetical protein
VALKYCPSGSIISEGEAMTRLICDVCGVNDYIVYIIVPEGTFCTNCYDLIKYSFLEGEVFGGGFREARGLRHDQAFPTMMKECQPRTVNFTGTKRQISEVWSIRHNDRML